jgi:hypothetical protein
MTTVIRFPITRSAARDRAAALAVAILQIVYTAPAKTALQEMERYLRDELADLACKVAADREQSNA